MISQQVTRLLSRRVVKCPSIIVRHHNFDGEIPSKTHMSMITKEDESHNYITSYSNHGLRLSSGLSVLGPCAVFPRAVLHWNVPSAEEITPESLTLFTLLEPKLDILIIGKGDWNAKVDFNIIKFLRSKHINFEILPTEQACSTFNFLNSERRAVAAAIIPPINVPDEFEEDLMRALRSDEVHEMEEFDLDRQIKSLKNESLVSILSSQKDNRRKLSGESQDGQDETKSDVEQDPKK